MELEILDQKLVLYEKTIHIEKEVQRKCHSKIRIFSTNFRSMRVGGEYNSYSMDVYEILSSSNSLIHSQTQLSRESNYTQSQPISYPHCDYQKGQSHVISYLYG